VASSSVSIRNESLTEDDSADRTRVANILCCLFEEVLGVTGVMKEDNFFDLGGHSLLAIWLVNRIRSALNVEVSMRTILDAPTIGELAAEICERPR